MAKPRVVEHFNIRRGGHSYEISEIERADGRSVYLAKRDDGRRPFGNIFHSKSDLVEHYPSIRGELRRRLK